MVEGENTNESIDQVVERNYGGPSFQACTGIATGLYGFYNYWPIQGMIADAISYTAAASAFAAPLALAAYGLVLGYGIGLGLKVGYNIVKGISNRIKNAFKKPAPAPEQPAPTPVPGGP